MILRALVRRFARKIAGVETFDKVQAAMLVRHVKLAQYPERWAIFTLISLVALLSYVLPRRFVLSSMPMLPTLCGLVHMHSGCE